jgi:hypothetical protein
VLFLPELFLVQPLDELMLAADRPELTAIALRVA